MMDEIREGLWRWEAPHPEWHTRIEWGHRVASYAASAGPELVLVDPLVPADGEETWSALDELAARHDRVAVVVTIPYHVRSSAEVAKRYGDRVTIHGHRALSRRLPASAPFRAAVPGDEIAGGSAILQRIGNPVRYEMPVLLRPQRALAFGDAVIAIHGEARVWQLVEDDRREAWYRDRFLPTLRPLLDLPFDHLLPTHGPAILDRGREALARGLEAGPWPTRSERDA
jgi:hypothetical protein